MIICYDIMVFPYRSVVNEFWQGCQRALWISFLLVAFSTGLDSGIGFSQEDTAQANRQLDQLRREIKEFEQRISESQTREENLLGELEAFDREIGLRVQLIQTLKQEKNQAEASLRKTQREIDRLNGEIRYTVQDSNRVAAERDSLAALVGRRAIYSYKHFKRDVLKAILTSQTVVQMLTRQEYIKRIAEADRHNLERLDQKNKQLTNINIRLRGRRDDKNDKLKAYERAAAYKEQLIEEENAEAELLKNRRDDRELLLNRIRDDQDIMRQQLSEKKLAAQRIESLIRSLETKREALPVAPEVAWAPEVPFPHLKGKMNWPANGKVVSLFGLQRNRQLETVTENPGIEIAAGEDNPVKAVCTGQVTKITWLRGYGNTILIDHRDGYYTVYAHLGAILVREGQIVQAGEVIGRVGQSGSLEGPRLHFEIWAQREKQDPLSWLVRR